MYEYAYESMFYSWLMVVTIIFAFLILCAIALEKRKTKKYREMLSDIYVSAKIREIAKSENINLDDEYVTFLKWYKRRKYEDWAYDSVIEAELKEKVEEKLNKKSE